jgi:hypothetical protein
MTFHFRETPFARVELRNAIYELVIRLIPPKGEIDWDIGRNVPCKPRFVSGAKGHDVEENTLPGSAALWAGSFK